LYAEDGTVLLRDALLTNFPKEFFQPITGYSLLIQRIAGRFISIFPLEISPAASAIFAALCLSVLAAGIFKFSNFRSESFWPRFLLSVCFIFLPLASFSAVGNSANLYVYFMTASAVFIYHKEESKREIFYKSCILTIAALSLPLTIFLIPMIIHRSFLERKETNRWRIQKSEKFFIVALLLHFIFIALTSLGERTPHSPQSFFKVFYLYLERGIGISIIPMWGFVSGTKDSPVYENTPSFLSHLPVRVIVLSIAIAVLGTIYSQRSKFIDKDVHKFFWFIIGLGFCYSIILGLFFNVEPRYMIFTSFLTYWGILLLVEDQGDRLLKIFLKSYLILVLILGLTASVHRSSGPDWLTELQKAKYACLALSPNDEVKIRILPISRPFNLVLPCRVLGSPNVIKKKLL